MGRTWLAVLAFAATALAGCSDGGDGTADGSSVVTSEDIVDVPRLELGQHWTFTGEIGEFTLVVSEATEGRYRMDTDDATLALFDAHNDPVFLGLLDEDDLAGDQGGQSVGWLKWPLQDGATWSTTWHGERRDITASRQEDGTFMMTATSGSSKAVEYVYDPAADWVTSMTFFHDNGTRRAGIDMVDHGTEFSGELVRYAVVGDGFSGSWSAPGGADDSFQVPEGVNELAVRATVSCAGSAAGQVDLQAGETDTDAMVVSVMAEPRVQVTAQCPGEAAVGGAYAPADDVWAIRVAGLSNGGGATLDVEFRTRTTFTL